METLAAKKLPGYRQVFDGMKYMGNRISFDLETGKISNNVIKEQAWEEHLLRSELYLWSKKEISEKGGGNPAYSDVSSSIFALGHDKMIWKWLEHANRKHKAPEMEATIYGYQDGSKNGVYAVWYYLTDAKRNDFYKVRGAHVFDLVDEGEVDYEDVAPHFTRMNPNGGVVLVGSSKKAEEDAHRLASYMKAIGILNVVAYGYGQNQKKQKSSLIESLKAQVKNAEAVAFKMLDEIKKAKGKNFKLNEELGELKSENKSLQSEILARNNEAADSR